MSINGNSTHLTVTNRIPQKVGRGWEFVCTECGYHARYWDSAEPGKQNLEILSLGDPAARHTSNVVSPQAAGETEWETYPQMNCIQEDRSGDLPDVLSAEIDEENWLTPELRMQLELILKAFDTDEPEGPAEIR